MPASSFTWSAVKLSSADLSATVPTEITTAVLEAAAFVRAVLRSLSLTVTVVTPSFEEVTGVTVTC
ncbi:hypothetical protein D3C81_2290690 [compost metagenome]